MKRNRNPRRLHHQKRECWVNRIPVADLSSWRWLTNARKPVKRLTATRCMISRHKMHNVFLRWGKMIACAGALPDAERVEWGRIVL